MDFLLFVLFFLLKVWGMFLVTVLGVFVILIFIAFLISCTYSRSKL